MGLSLKIPPFQISRGSKGTKGVSFTHDGINPKNNRRACGIHEGSKKCHRSSIRGDSKRTKVSHSKWYPQEAPKVYTCINPEGKYKKLQVWT